MAKNVLMQPPDLPVSTKRTEGNTNGNAWGVSQIACFCTEYLIFGLHKCVYSHRTYAKIERGAMDTDSTQTLQMPYW